MNEKVFEEFPEVLASIPHNRQSTLYTLEQVEQLLGRNELPSYTEIISLLGIMAFYVRFPECEAMQSGAGRAVAKRASMIVAEINLKCFGGRL